MTIAQGYNTEGDVLVDKTADGINLNALWGEFNEVLALFNRERSAVSSLLSFSTDRAGEAVPQTITTDSFDVASEFGVPTGLRADGEGLIVGYDFTDYDKASRFTWKFLRDASAQQVQAQFERILDADNRLVTGSILDRLFNPEQRLSPEGHNVYGLYTGKDGMVPPPYLGHTFSASEAHYLTTQSEVIDSADIEDAIRLIQDKGYGTALSGGQLVIIASAAEADEIASWKKGQPNGSDPSAANAPVARHDFVPSASADPYLTTEQIIGQIPSGEYGQLKVLGQYGPALLLEPSAFIPDGYCTVVATGGPGSPLNPVAIRHHADPSYTGLRMIPGRDQRYPLQDSFFVRSFGTGVRHRGAAVAIQTTTATDYTAPVIQK